MSDVLGSGCRPMAVACFPGASEPQSCSIPSAAAGVEVAIASSSSAGMVLVCRARNCSSFQIERSGLEARLSVPSATGVP